MEAVRYALQAVLPVALLLLLGCLMRKRGLVFFSLAWFFLVVALARPQIGARLKEKRHKGAEIMIALDVSNSMLAQDYAPNRLERA